MNRDESTTISHGVVSVIGRQRSMEDAVTVIPNLVQITPDHNGCSDAQLKSSYDFFAVYDGHGGSVVAHQCKERLHQLIAEEILAEASRTRGGGQLDWERLMGISFARMGVQVATYEEPPGEDLARSSVSAVGSKSILVVVMGKEEVVVANSGNCRAVLYRGGAALPLSRDHTKGEVSDMISEADVTVYQRTESDTFVIIASDGLWDVVSNDVACEVARKCLSGQVKRKVLEEASENCAVAAATVLVELAIARGSRDNISVIVIQLQKP